MAETGGHGTLHCRAYRDHFGPAGGRFFGAFMITEAGAAPAAGDRDQG